MSSGGTFVDRIDPFANRKSLKKKPKKSQGSSRYRTGGDVELTALPLLKGNLCPLNLPLLNNVAFKNSPSHGFKLCFKRSMKVENRLLNHACKLVTWYLFKRNLLIHFDPLLLVCGQISVSTIL